MKCYKPNEQTIIPPDGGWKERTWYVVEVSYRLGNPIHRSLYYTGFLNGGGKKEKWPGGYNVLVPLSGPSDEDPNHGINNVKYLKYIRELISEDQAEKITSCCPACGRA